MNKSTYFDKNLIRKDVAKKAAEIMYFNGISDYKAAKIKAIKSFPETNNLLPSNEEIKKEIDFLIKIYKGYSNMEEYLFFLREKVLNLMFHIYNFSPLLVGQLCNKRISMNANIELLIFLDEDKNDLIQQIEQKYEVENLQKNKMKIFISADDFSIEIFLLIVPKKQKNKYLNNYFYWNTYKVAKSVNKLDLFFNEEEKLEEYEHLNDEDCFLHI
jgi:hypothetical protein